jgi:hypothetical protein
MRPTRSIVCLRRTGIGGHVGNMPLQNTLNNCVSLKILDMINESQ